MKYTIKNGIIYDEDNKIVSVYDAVDLLNKHNDTIDTFKNGYNELLASEDPFYRGMSFLSSAIRNLK